MYSINIYAPRFLLSGFIVLGPARLFLKSTHCVRGGIISINVSLLLL